MRCPGTVERSWISVVCGSASATAKNGSPARNRTKAVWRSGATVDRVVQSRWQQRGQDDVCPARPVTYDVAPQQRRQRDETDDAERDHRFVAPQERQRCQRQIVELGQREPGLRDQLPQRLHRVARNRGM